MTKKRTPINTAPSPVMVAILDANSVYQGMETIAAAAVTAAHVPLPDGCDLPPNRFFWDAARGCFWPLIGTADKGATP